MMEVDEGPADHTPRGDPSRCRRPFAPSVEARRGPARQDLPAAGRRPDPDRRAVGRSGAPACRATARSLPPHPGRSQCGAVRHQAAVSHVGSDDRPRTYSVRAIGGVEGHASPRRPPTDPTGSSRQRQRGALVGRERGRSAVRAPVPPGGALPPTAWRTGTPLSRCPARRCSSSRSP